MPRIQRRLAQRNKPIAATLVRNAKRRLISRDFTLAGEDGQSTRQRHSRAAAKWKTLVWGKEQKGLSFLWRPFAPRDKPATKPRKLNPSLSPREERGGEVSHNERSRPGKGHGRVLFGATSAGRRSTWKDKQSGAVVDHVSRRSPFLCLPICPSIFPEFGTSPTAGCWERAAKGKGAPGSPCFPIWGRGWPSLDDTDPLALVL